MAVDFRKYTVEETAKQFALLEIHLRQFSGDNDIFCLECCAKHLLAIEGLADEGVGFFPESPEDWREIADWAHRVVERAQTGEVSAQLAKDWAEKSRLYRKGLQAKHMGVLGRCECVSGYEPCCKAKEEV